MKKTTSEVGTWIIMGSTLVAQYPEIPIARFPVCFTNSRIDISIQPAASVPMFRHKMMILMCLYIQQFYQASLTILWKKKSAKEMNIQSLSSEIIISGKSRVYDVDDFTRRVRWFVPFVPG
ncbi:MAG: hypothetical protein ACLRTD_26735 [Bacteroides sp.]